MLELVASLSLHTVLLMLLFLLTGRMKVLQPLHGALLGGCLFISEMHLLGW